MRRLFTRKVRSGRPPRRRPFGVVVITLLQVSSALALLAITLLVNAGLGPNLVDYLRSLQPYSFNLYEAIFWYASVFQASGLLPEQITGNTLLTVLILLVALRLMIITGFWFLKRWGWVLLMVQLGLVMLVDLYTYFNGVPHFLSMLNSVLVVFYLNQREVQLAFQVRKPVVETV